MKSINNQFRFIQIFACLFVLSGHCIPNYNDKNRLIYKILEYGYLIRMPLFFIISGYFFYNIEKIKNTNLHDFFIPKINKLLIPYFFLNTIAYFPKILLNKYALRKVELGLNEFIESYFFIDKIVIKYLWFLPVLFILYIVFYLIYKATKDETKFFLISIFIIVATKIIFDKNPITLLGLSYVFEYGIWFFIGILYKKNEKYFFAFTNNLMIFFISIINIFIAFLIQPLDPSNEFLKLIFTISSILLIFTISNKYSNIFTKGLIFKYLSKYYYQIYLLSWFCIIPFKILYQKNIITYEVTFTLMFFTSIIFSILISKLIEEKFNKIKILIGL